MDTHLPFCSLCGAQARTRSAKYCHACGGDLATGEPINTNFVNELPGTEAKVVYLQEGHVLKQQYRIHEQLGEGGMGTVYKAQDIKLNRPVAVKEMRLQGLYGRGEIQKAVDGFRQEAQMLASLKHQSLPLIYDYFEELSYWYLVMEFIEGITLRKHFDNAQGGYLPIDEVIVIGIKLCIVLEYLHARQPQIIFRDVKPDNIMFTPDRRLYLIDFGIARNFHTTTLTAEQKWDTVPSGTLGYAPPEQYGKSAHTTPRSDIYALGVTLHELLTGKDPTAKLGHFDPLELGAQMGAVELEELIMHMLKRSELERPENVIIIRRRLEHIGNLRARPLPPPPPPVKAQDTVVPPPVKPEADPPSPPPPAEQTPEAEISASEKALQDFIAHKQTRSNMTPASSPQDPVPTSAEIVEQEVSRKTQSMQTRPQPIPQSPASMGEREIQCDGRIWSLACSLDGKRLVTVGEHVQVWDVLSGRLQAAYEGHEHEELVEAVAWSSKNQLIASGSWDHTVQVWNADAARRSKSYRGYVYRGHKDNVRALAWSPDGYLIASAGKDPTIQIWKHLNGEFSHSFSIHKDAITSLVWSPDNRYLASSSYDKTIKIIDVTKGAKESIVCTFQGHKDAVYCVSWSPDGRYLASSAADGSVYVWNPSAKGDIVFTYPGHTAGVYSIAWSPDSKHLATSSMDKRVQLWDAFSGSSMGSYTCSTDRVMAVSWSPGGEYIAFGDNDLLQIKYVG